MHQGYAPRRYGPAMDIEPTTPLGIALIVVGAFVAIKAAKVVVKVLMLLVIGVGVYIWLGGGDLDGLLRR